MSGSDEAVGYIKSHCKHLGSYCGDFSPHAFLVGVAEEMAAAPREHAREHPAER